MDDTDRGAEPLTSQDDAEALIARLKRERAEKFTKATDASSELKHLLIKKEKPQPPVDPWQPTLAAGRTRQARSRGSAARSG
jgi:hypothetical protein